MLVDCGQGTDMGEIEMLGNTFARNVVLLGLLAWVLLTSGCSYVGTTYTANDLYNTGQFHERHATGIESHSAD